MTLLAVSIQVDRLHDLDSCAQQAWSQGAEAIELRIDTFQDNPAELADYLRNHSDRTWIVTCRSAAEGGRFEGRLDERVVLLSAAVRGTGVSIDFEWADWSKNDDLAQRITSVDSHTSDSVPRIILSSHDFKSCPDNMNDRMDAMISGEGVVAAKIAYQARHICDSFEALDLMHEYGPRASVIAMGEDGLWTRILSKKFDSFATYCALQADRATAPGQITLHEMVHEYRWPDINESTRVFGVIGDPVSHSMSPPLFNRWFAQTGMNAVYLPLRVASNGDCLQRFLDGCCARSWLDIGGFSVTLPHKSAALHWVGDAADSMARWIGALNTLVFQDEAVKGYNTDCYAAMSSVTDALGCDRSDLSGMIFDVLGAGGSARALLQGLREFGCRVTVYGRSLSKTQRVAEEFGFTAASWDERIHGHGEVLINCTPVGLWPKGQISPMPVEALSGYRLVFDLIYNPLETRLLHFAKQVGAIALNGADMFVRQAAMQFELWTGQKPDRETAGKWMAAEMGKR